MVVLPRFRIVGELRILIWGQGVQVTDWRAFKLIGYKIRRIGEESLKIGKGRFYHSFQIGVEKFYQEARRSGHKEDVAEMLRAGGFLEEIHEAHFAPAAISYDQKELEAFADAAQDGAFSGAAPVAHPEDCPGQCYGTGYWKGFGAPCSKRPA